MPETSPSSPRFRKTIAAGAIAVLGLALAGCGTSTASDGTAGPGSQSVNLQLRFTPSVQFAGSYAADHFGYYENESVDVTMTAGGASIAVEPLLVQGTADIAMSSPGTTARAVSEGAPLTIIAAGNQSSAGAIVSLADDPIERVEDLAGKRIGVVTSNTSVGHFLTSNGIKASDVEIVPIQGDATPLINGQVDGMYGLVTSQVVALELQGYEPVALRFSDNGMDSLDLTYVVPTADLEDAAKRETIIHFLMAEILGWESAVEDPAGIADIVVAEYAAGLGLDVAQQSAQASAQVQLVRPDGSTPVLTMSSERIADTLATLEAQSIKADASLFDASLVAEAYARLGR